MSERPLEGWRIVVTRPRAQAEAFSSRLETLGASVIEFPTIAIEPPANTRPLDEAMRALESYDWIIFTSVNGVRQFWQRARELGADLSPVSRLRVAAIGPATAGELRAHDVEPEIVPDEFVAEAIVEALPDVGGLRILLPRADIARPVLREQLIDKGAQVDEVAAYRTVRGKPDESAFAALRSGVDVLTFTSASTVRNFVDIVGDDLEAVLRETAIACIGPITERAARERGLPVHVVASEYTVDGLIEAIVNAKGELLTGVAS